MSGQPETTTALAVAVAARIPVLLWGAPGTGKTTVIRALAEAARLPCETVIASIREPADLPDCRIAHSRHAFGRDVRRRFRSASVG